MDRHTSLRRSSKVRRPADANLKSRVVVAIEQAALVPPHRVKVQVADGGVTLDGEVERDDQRTGVELAVRSVDGVKDVINELWVSPGVMPAEVRQCVEDALHRMAEVEARRITVETHAGTVVLEGTVASRTVHDAALAAVCAVPGVTAVDDRLKVAGLI